MDRGLNEAQARAFVDSMQAQEDAHHGIFNAKLEAARAAAEVKQKPHDAETCDTWFKRYLPTKECGVSHRRISNFVWQKWVSPVMGPKVMRDLTRDDVEDVRDKLDRAIDAKEIRHSTARNAWGTFTGALKAACASRDRSLRVHATPLHVGVLPPEHGESRQRPWLYPNEWSRLVNCPTIPVEWRQTYAIALYTGLRPGELQALTWSDVDLDAHTISISKSYDRATSAENFAEPAADPDS